ncbi:MAG: hypothetical protein ACTSW1_05320 [Candidatus Hodarchaeales archaeon]
MVFEDVLVLLTNFYFVTLILGGILSASWLFERLEGVSSEDIAHLSNVVAIIGFIFGILSFLSIGGGIYLISKNYKLPRPFDFVSLALLTLLGLVLILRPIKDFRIGVFISLSVALLGASLLVFLGSDSVKFIAFVFIALFIVIYLSIKIFEDLYLIIAEILASPLISVSIGIFCFVQGLAGILGWSLGFLIQI